MDAPPRRSSQVLRLALSIALVTQTPAFDLTCFGPGRGITLPGEDNTGRAAMVLPNDDWLRDRPSSLDYAVPECVVQYYPPRSSCAFTSVSVQTGVGSGCPPGCLADQAASPSSCTGRPRSANTCTSADPTRDQACRDAFARSGVGAAAKDCPRGCTWRYKKGARPEPYQSNEYACRTVIAGSGRATSKNEWVGGLADPQNPPLWAPRGRPADILSLINKGTDIDEDRIDILTYRQVTTWRIENLARLFVPLLERQIQTASSLATVRILSVNATDPPVRSAPDANNDGVGEGEIIDMVWADFTLTTEWKKGEAGPWIDLSGTPQTAPFGRPGGTLNLLERDPLDANKAHFLKSFWVGSSTWNDLSTVGGCVNPAQCETKLVSPTDVHQTMFTYPGEPDIKTYIEYTVENQQPCNGQAAAKNAFNLADSNNDKKLTADEIPPALFEMGITPPRACIDATGQEIVAGTQDACEKQETGWTFQFATVSKCGLSWIGEDVGSTWHCELGFPCVDATCLGAANLPVCSGTDEDLCPAGCDFEDDVCAGAATRPDCAQTFLSAASASETGRSVEADCPAGCTFTPDDPDTGRRRFFDQAACEWTPILQEWVFGTAEACILRSDRTQRRPGAAAMTVATQCQLESSGYIFSPTVEALCVDTNGVEQLDTQNRAFTSDDRCRGVTDPGGGGQATNSFTGQSFQSCLRWATCTGVASDPVATPDCANPLGVAFSQGDRTAPTCPTGCTYTAETTLQTWVYSGITDENQLRENCEIQDSGYEFRSCRDDVTLVSVVASSEHDCKFVSTGVSWQPEVDKACFNKEVAPWLEVGIDTDEEACEYEPSGNSWYANRWISAKVERTSEGGGMTMVDLQETYPAFVPADGRCVTQTYRANGNSVREYKCVPDPACGERCRDFTTAHDDCSSADQVVNECGYGRCTPRNLKYGNQSLIKPVYDWRCWDSCKPIPESNACSHLIEQRFLVDELVESAALVAEYVESFAATCDDEFGALGFESECKAMRCHHMATVFQTICSNPATLPPCRSTCQTFVRNKREMGLVSLDDCARLIIKINVSDPPNNWARSHCKAIQDGDCSDFPADDSGLCAQPVRYSGGTPCLVDSQCLSEGCPLAEEGPITNEEGFGGFCCAEGLGRCSERGLCGADGLCHCFIFWAGDDCSILTIPPWIIFMCAFVCGGASLTVCVVRHYDDINWQLDENGKKLEDFITRNASKSKFPDQSLAVAEQRKGMDDEESEGSPSSRRSSPGPGKGRGGKKKKKKKQSTKPQFSPDGSSSPSPQSAQSTGGAMRRGRARAVLSLEEMGSGDDGGTRSLEGTPREKRDMESDMEWVEGSTMSAAGGKEDVLSPSESAMGRLDSMIEEDVEEEEEEEEEEEDDEDEAAVAAPDVANITATSEGF